MHKLSNIGDYAIFKQDEPLFNVIQIRDYFLDVEGSGFAKEFRWSNDNKVYSAWTEMTMDSLRSVKLNSEDELWVEAKFTLTEDNTVNINSFSLDLEFKKLNNNNITSPIFKCSENGNLLSSTDLQNICFDPYAVNPAACLYQELSYTVNNLFGHEVEYFKCDPDEKSKDITFNEYSIYSVTKQKCIKVLVDNNEFPDSSLEYNPFGIDFERPFEVHIDKNYWEEQFGKDTGPQKRDIIYFKLNNRIYEVISSYLFRAFMERDSYWKVSLIKYQPKANRYESQEIRDTLDYLSTDSSELFEKEYREQEEKISKPDQYSRYKGEGKYDPSRASINKEIEILESDIENYSTIISEYQYKLSGLVNLSNIDQQPAIIYREVGNLSESEEFSYSCWFAMDKFKFYAPEDLVTNMSLNTSSNELLITINKNRSYQEGEYLMFNRDPEISFYGKIISINSQTEFLLSINPDVIKYLDSFNSMWTGLSGYSVQKIVPNNFIHAMNQDNQGLSINLFANRFFSVLINETEYIIPLNKNIRKGDYYGLFINMSNKFDQISLYLWERKWKSGVLSSPQTTDLFNNFSMTINDVDNIEFNSNVNYEIKSSNLIITNIRVYDQTLEVEKQSNLLNQNVVQDEQRTIIIDNAFPSSQLSFIGQTE